MDKLNRNISQKTIGTIKETIIDITTKNKKFHIEPKSTKKMVKDAFNKVLKQKKDFKMLLRVMTPSGLRTFNIDEEGNILQFDDDYYKGKVKTPADLERGGRVMISVTTYGHKEKSMFY